MPSSSVALRPMAPGALRPAGSAKIGLMKPILVLLAAAAVMPDLNQLKQMSARFAPVNLKYDTSRLSAGDRKALAKLVEAARILNWIFLDQLWSGNRALYEKLRKDTTPLGKERAHYFWLNKGPWSDLDAHQAFLPGVPERKPLGANFYPEDMTREEFEAWAKTLPAAQRHEAKGFFTVIRRDAGRKLTAVPYSKEYAADLKRAAGLLREAAALTDNASLKKFLTLRADAFLSNDYYASDVAWMDLDAPLDITIGPYETYNDELFGYKAAFEAYVTLRDEADTNRLHQFAARMQEIENNLPIDREVPQSQARRIGAHPRGERSLRRRRRRPRRAHRRLQPAQRRARGAREGQQARHAEEHSGGQVRVDPEADRRPRAAPRPPRPI